MISIYTFPADYWLSQQASTKIKGRVSAKSFGTGLARFNRAIRTLNKAQNLRYVGYGVLALILVLPMLFAGATPQSPVITTTVAAISVDASSLQALTPQVVEPVQKTVTIEVTPSSQYLEEQAQLKAAVAKQAAAEAAKKAALKVAVQPKTDILSAIRYCESHNNYQAQNRYSSASGAYQFLDSTWGYFGGYQRAKDAPAELQDQKAYQTLQLRGTAPWNASRSCWYRYIS